MLIRISLIIAILAGLAIGALNFTQIKDKVVALQTDLQQTKETLASTQQELSTTKSTLAKTSADLKRTQTQLADATNERDVAVAKADAADKKAQKATEDLATANQNLLATRQELNAYQNSGLTPEQAFNAAKTIKNFEAMLAGAREENKKFGQIIKRQEAELAIYRDPEYHISLPATLQGQVVVCDPKWDFVVLNIGEDQNLVEKSELLVSRNGKLVAKVIVRSVQKGRSIANVMPGWKLEEVLEGDSVIPAYPSS